MNRVELLESRRLLSSGEIDRAFGKNGSVFSTAELPALTAHSDLRAVTSLQLAGGKTLLVGKSEVPRDRYYSYTPDTNITLARFRSDGSLDTGFDNDGYKQIGFGAERFTEPVDARVDSLGRIVLLARVNTIDGYSTELYDAKLAVIRLLPDGRLDRSFDDDGKRLLGEQLYPFYLSAHLAIDPGNRVVVAANSYTGSYAVELMRLRESGRFDTSFDHDGRLTVPLLDGSTVSAIRIQNDGKLVFAGPQVDDYSAFVMRLRTDGTRDPSFDGDGKRTIVAVPGAIHEVFDLQLSTNGRVTIGGNTVTGSPQGSGGFISRLRNNGASDGSFAGNGLLVSTDLFPDDPRRFDRIFVSGSKLFVTTPEHYFPAYAGMIVKLNRNGTRDTGFGNNGQVAIDKPPGQQLLIHRADRGDFIAFSYLSDPGIEGYGSNGQQILRYSSQFESDAAFKHGAIAFFGRLFGTREAVDAAGRLIVTGGDYQGGVVTAFKTDGKRDLSFGFGSFKTLGFDAGFHGATPVPFGDGRVLLDGRGFDSSDGDGIAVLPEWLLPSGHIDARYRRSDYIFPSGDETGRPQVQIVDNNYTSAAWNPFGRSARTAILYGANGPVVFELPYMSEGEFPGNRSFSADFVLPINGGADGYYVAGDLRVEYDDPPTIMPSLARYNADGEIDLSFGDHGFLFDSLGSPITAQSDGSLIIRPFGGAVLARMRADGSIDPTFGTAGTAAIGFDRFNVDSAGRIIAWRILQGGAADGDVQVLRLTTDGKPDSDFGGGDGLVVVDSRLASDATANLLVTPQNKIVVTAFDHHVAANTVRWSATRLQA